EIELEADEESSDESKDPNDVKRIKKRIKGLTEAQEDCVVVVFADVDFISDAIAYQSSFFASFGFRPTFNFINNNKWPLKVPSRPD
ncbi:unnamed protein product, partial [marine sediment metagenome]